MRSNQLRPLLPSSLLACSLLPFDYRGRMSSSAEGHTLCLSSGHSPPASSEPWASNLFPLSLLYYPPSNSSLSSVC